MSAKFKSTSETLGVLTLSTLETTVVLAIPLLTILSVG